MSETINAWNNVSSDFGWLPSFVRWFGETVNNFGPAIALLGAVWLFFRRNKADRAETERREKVELYRELAGRIEKVYVMHGREDFDLDGEWQKLYALCTHIEILGDDEVSELSNSTVSALITLCHKDRPSTLSRDGKQRTKIEDFFWERRQLIAAMKKAVKK